MVQVLDVVEDRRWRASCSPRVGMAGLERLSRRPRHPAGNTH